MRRGITLIEIITVLGILAVLSAITLPRLGAWLDAHAVHAAAGEVASAFSLARQAAISRGQFAAVFVDSATASVRVAVGGETILRRDLGLVHRISLRGNRDSLAFDAIGHGYGASNQTIVLSRGSSTDSVVVSRLGRVRYRG